MGQFIANMIDPAITATVATLEATITKLQQEITVLIRLMKPGNPSRIQINRLMVQLRQFITKYIGAGSSTHCNRKCQQATVDQLRIQNERQQNTIRGLQQKLKKCTCGSSGNGGSCANCKTLRSQLKIMEETSKEL